MLSTKLEKAVAAAAILSGFATCISLFSLKQSGDSNELSLESFRLTAERTHNAYMHDARLKFAYMNCLYRELGVPLDSDSVLALARVDELFGEADEIRRLLEDANTKVLADYISGLDRGKRKIEEGFRQAITDLRSKAKDDVKFEPAERTCRALGGK